MTQRTIFDAIAARDEALERVEAATDPTWADIALQAVYLVAERKATFTSEDIWEIVKKPREPRALGPVLIKAVRLGYCEPMGFVQSGMTSRHAAPVRVYRSLISVPPTASTETVSNRQEPQQGNVDAQPGVAPRPARETSL